MVPETKAALRAYCHVSVKIAVANPLNFVIAWRLATRGDQPNSDKGNVNAKHRPQRRPLELNHEEGAQDAGRADQAAQRGHLEVPERESRLPL